MRRRTFLIATGLIGAGCALVPTPLLAARRFGGETLRAGVAALEAGSGGRMGVAILDTQTGARFAWRGGERFPMCSTFKTALAALLLWRAARGAERLDRPIAIGAADLVPYAPFTETRVGKTATIAELCEAAVTLSDNAAANLLLTTIGGPVGLTRFIREQGDHVTRLDRIEPALNEAKPGDPRDTTTPLAMLALVDRLALGNVLPAKPREQLVTWLLASQTGLHRLRAGLPADWRVGDKTGAGNGSDNDVAILWPPNRKPILVASYIAGTSLDGDRSNAIHARLGALIAVAAGRGAAIG